MSFWPQSTLKKLSRELSRTYASIDRTARPLRSPGFVRNRWGTYWSASLLESWISINAELCSQEDEDERCAAMYSRASMLLSIHRLAEARTTVDELIKVRPSAPATKILALIEARSGNVDGARELAQRVKEMPHGGSFAVTEDEIQSEARLGLAFHEDERGGETGR